MEHLRYHRYVFFKSSYVEVLLLTINQNISEPIYLISSVFSHHYIKSKSHSWVGFYVLPWMLLAIKATWFFPLPSNVVDLVKVEKGLTANDNMGRDTCVCWKFKGLKRILHARKNRLKTITTTMKHENNKYNVEFWIYILKNVVVAVLSREHLFSSKFMWERPRHVDWV